MYIHTGETPIAKYFELLSGQRLTEGLKKKGRGKKIMAESTSYKLCSDLSCTLHSPISTKICLSTAMYIYSKFYLLFGLLLKLDQHDLHLKNICS